MGKKIKFTLEMKDGVQARTLEDIQQNFDLEKVVGYFSDGRLKTWLEDRYYDEEAKAVEDIDKTSPDFHRKLCESLGVAFQEDALPKVDLEALERRKERLERLKQYTADATLWEKVDQVAFDQEELGNLLDEGVEEIVLCNNTFRIPLREKNKKYIGAGHAEAVIKSKKKVDFDTLGISFSNVKFDAEYEKNVLEAPDKFYEMANSAYDEGNFDDAFDNVLKSAEMGNVNALWGVGTHYFLGQGVAQDYAKAMKWFLKAADAGDATAMCSIGFMYDNGEGVPKDKQKAVEWYQRGAEAGDAGAMTRLGDAYRLGAGVTENKLKAIEWYQKAADAGDVEAMNLVGQMYDNGEGVPEDKHRAMEWYQKAADAGDATTMCYIGIMYDNGVGVPEDKQKAMEWYQKAADAGDATAMRNIGYAYHSGDGIPEDKYKAMEWYRKAADAGDAIAMNHIGYMYDKGEGAPEDKQKAMQWYLKAADDGNTTAMRNIGYVYRFGNGVREDKQKAFEWYQKAADAGDADAMNIVGLMYDIGEGVNKNTHQAAQWYEKAIREGNLPVAMYNLALLRYDDKQYCDPSKIMKLMETAADSGCVDAMIAAGNWYLNGQNVPQNSARGMLWLHKAVEQGSAEAMCDIGYAYDEGNGVSQNYAEAVRWYKMAADAGNATAMRLIAKLYYNGNGVPENRGLAVQWLQRAIDAGDDTAVDWLNEMLREDNKSNKKKDGCFITTAVCDSFGKADDCYELTMFRQFRDTWFREQVDGESLIEEYYAIAPRIVSNINLLDNAKEVYHSIWTEYLKPCLMDLEAGDRVSCKKRYVHMVTDLKKKYFG